MAEVDQDNADEDELEIPDVPLLVASLQDLVSKGELAPERASFARQKIEDLHTALSKSKTVRRRLTNDRLDLSLQLEVEIDVLKKEMQLQAEDETTLDLLSEDLETVENESLLCRERKQALNLEEADLCKVQEDFEKRIKEIEEEHAAALTPQILQLKGDALVNVIKGLHVQELRQLDKIKEMENDLLSFQNAKRDLVEDNAKSCIELEKVRRLIEQKEQAVRELIKELELAVLEADQYLAERVNYDMQLKSTEMDYKHEQEILAQIIKEKERAIKKLKLLENELQSIQEMTPMVVAEKDKVHHQAVLSENEKKKVSAYIQELKKEFDLQMRNYLGIESVSKEVSWKLRNGYKEVGRLEKELLKCIELEYAQHHQMGELSSLREHMCRLLSSKLQICNEAKEKIRILDLVIGFLREKHNDVKDGFENFTKLYNMMRAQRNNLITSTQASKITMAELKDKAKRLEVELSMLQGELLYKDKVLYRMRKEFVSCLQSRFHLRTELIRCSKALQKQKELVDEKEIEVSRMNNFIHATEREVSLFRKHYEKCVLDRNNVGLSLIDRNDELCILYEKSNVQEEFFQISNIEMSKRDNEISFLKHQVGNLERSILICYTFVPKGKKLRSTISDLKCELKLVQSKSEELSDLVERPTNVERWKLLHACDPSETQLRMKLSFVEECLLHKEDESLEKDLVLQEISALAEDTKKQAAQHAESGKRTATQLTEYQHNIRTNTKKTMAVVSELSLIQAAAISLTKEKESLLKMIDEASAALLDGQVCAM